MTQQIIDRVKETTATVGAGALALAGAAIGYRTFASVCGVNDTCYYAIEGVNLDGTLTGEWETGFGTYSGVNTLTRTTVLASSNANNPVVFSAGTKQVWIDMPAAQILGLAKLSGASFTGELGVMAAAATDAALTAGIPSGTGTTLHGFKSDLTAPATATAALYGTKHVLRTAAAAFTLAAAVFFSASSLAKGAASAITTVKGFEASNAIVNDVGGSTTYGFWSDINKPATAAAYQLYMAGSAPSFFGGEVGVCKAPSSDKSVCIGAPSSAGTQLFGVVQSWNAASTATGGVTGYYSDLGTAAAAFTTAGIIHFSAANVTKGAGSTITAVYGFVAQAAIAQGASNYGFYSALNAAVGTYSFYSVGSAQSYLAGGLGLGTTANTVDIPLRIGQTGNATGTTQYGVLNAITGNAAGTTALYGIDSQLATANSAYTCNSLVHFYAHSTTRGAASTLSNAFGFAVDTSLAAAANNYAFWSNVASATNTYQLYMGGTALNYINGNLAVNVGPITSVAVYAGFPNTAGVQAAGFQNSPTVPATCTNLYYGFVVNVSTVPAAFTLSTLAFFEANSTSLGAGSAISTVIGYRVNNAIVVAGATTYGFFSGINAATNTYQLYMSGTAHSFFGGNVGISFVPQADQTLSIGPSIGTGAVKYGSLFSGTVPSTTTNTSYSYYSDHNTQAAAFTLTSLVHFKANATVKGAGSTITSLYGFYAANAIAVGSNNYGFYSDINTASNTYQLYMAGSALSYFGGPLLVISGQGASKDLVTIGGANAHPSDQLSSAVVWIDVRGPTTMTSNLYGVLSTLRTTAAAYVLTNVNHFQASQTVLGAGSTIGSVRGFFASNNIVAAGAAIYGFYSDIAAASSVYQLYMGGSGRSAFGGPVYHAQDNSTVQAVSALWQGTGVPNNANGSNGDFYLRGDTPGTANQRLYVKSAGAWVGIV